MKCAWLLFACVLAFPVNAAGASKKKPAPSSPAPGYISLRAWAAEHGFTYAHDSVKDECVLKSKWAVLFFEKDNRRCLVDGVTIWLSQSPIDSNNTIFIAQRDFTRHLLPILFPQKLAKGKKIKTIALSAGHGGKDPGYIFKKEYEKKYTLLLAREVQGLLQRAGYKVVMIRDKDVYVGLEEQAAAAIRARADLFVNLHFNAHPDADAKGVEVYCLTPAGASSTNGSRPATRQPGNKMDSFNVLLAYHVQKALLRDMAMLDRGVRRASFVVLKKSTMPCVLVEGGFMSNLSDSRKIFEATNRKKMALSIVDGIVAYKKIVER